MKPPFYITRNNLISTEKIESFATLQEAREACEKYKASNTNGYVTYHTEATVEAIELLADLKQISCANPTATLEELIPPGRVLYTMLDGEGSKVYYRRGIARVNRLDFFHWIDLGFPEWQYFD